MQTNSHQIGHKKFFGKLCENIIYVHISIITNNHPAQREIVTLLSQNPFASVASIFITPIQVILTKLPTHTHAREMPSTATTFA